jgi:uncharacterized protein (TIGR03437 family)
MLASLCLVSSAAIFAGPSTTIARLPNVQVNAAKVDASGNIVLAGQTTSTAGAIDAYVSKLSSGGSTTYYAVMLGGSGSSTSAAVALDIDSAGAVYVAGTTTASDFPVTSGAAQSAGGTAFAVKLDAQGNIVYATEIGGSANTLPGSVAVNTAGELAVSGQATPQASPPAAPAPFLLKLSADGATVSQGPPGIGGLVAIDSQNNVYVAGAAVSQYGATPPASTPGAFQGPPAISYCGCPFLSFPCGPNQYVASLTPDLAQTRFLTYLSAKLGAIPASVAVDGQGNVLVAGTTSSPAYPTTPGSYQPTYTAHSGVVETCGPPIPMEVTSPSGYVTLLKSDGTGLIFSTFFSGSNSDTITFAALTGDGITLAGQASSEDLPGFDGAVPSECLPVGYVTRLTPDGSAITATRTPPGTPLVYDSTTGTLLLISGSDLIRFDPEQPTSIACVLDAADLGPVTAVAPGELLSLFGRFLFFASDELYFPLAPVNGSFPVTWQGVGVAASNVPAPLLYVSGQQINIQTPYEVAADPELNLTVTYPDINGDTVSDSRTLRVAARNPVAFLSQPSNYNVAYPLTLNADGTVNSETNPAATGSVVTIFLDGLGVTSPAPVTGLINTSPVPLSVPITVTAYCEGPLYCYDVPVFFSAGSLAGSISGVTQVQLLAPNPTCPGCGSLAMFSLSAGATPLRDMNLAFWVE